jgi:putative aldouronate transport system substrate-binding protein
MLLALAGVLLAGGCSGKKQAPTAGGDDLSQRYTFSIGILNPGNMVGTDFNSDDVAQHFRNRFNFTWDVSQYGWDQYGQIEKIWINTMDMPDVVFCPFGFNDYKNWTEQGLVKQFPAGWKDQYPNLAVVFERSTLGPELERRFGNIAYFPSTLGEMPTKPRLVMHHSIVFRKDWARALGFEIKNQYTLQEFTAMIERFMAEGSSLPGVVQGRTDTWNLSAVRVVAAFLNSQWIYATQFYKNDEGRYVWGPDNPRTFELTEQMKNAIGRGIVSRNFASFQGEEQDALFATGQAFAIYNGAHIQLMNRYFNQFREATGLDPYDCLQQAVLTDPDGRLQEMESLNYWCGLYFNPDMSDAKFARLLSILDAVASPEGQNLVRWGFEGKDYTVDGGTMTVTRSKDANGNFMSIESLYPGAGVFSYVPMNGGGLDFIDPANPPGIVNSVKTMYAVKQSLGVDTGTVRPYNFETAFFDGPSFIRFNINAGAELIRIAGMPGDLRTNYDNWLRNVRPVVDPVLAELNAAFGK